MARGSGPTTTRRPTRVLRYSRGTAQNGFSLTGMGYWADWNSTDQVPQRAIDDGRHRPVRPRRRFRPGAGKPPDGRRRLAARVGLHVAARHRLRAAQQPEPVLELHLLPRRSRTSGDQFEQAERRVTAGGRFTYRRLGHVFDRHSRELRRRAGASRLARSGRALSHGERPAALHHARRSRRPDDDRALRPDRDRVDAHGADDARAARRRLSVRRHVRSTRSTPGDGTSGLVSPKFGVVFGPWAGTEWYVNAGTGYHSNDARGTVITVDPGTGEPADASRRSCAPRAPRSACGRCG